MIRLGLVVVAALALVPAALAAPAADRPDPRLDALASGIAGHAVHVYCEDDFAEWHTAAYGFTFPPEYVSTVWLHPWVCGTLHDMLDRTPGLALNAEAFAIHALVHESVHQRGGEFADCFATGPDDLGCEGRTDCMALSLDEQAAVDYFGFTRTITKVKVVRKHKKVTRIYTVVPNPVMNDLRWQFNAIHAALPEAYRGGC